MISSGDNLRPPSIGWKMSAVICGKSEVVRPAALASSIGSLFLQPATTAQKISAQLPTVTMRRIFIDLPAVTGHSPIPEVFSARTDFVARIFLGGAFSEQCQTGKVFFSIALLVPRLRQT